MYPKKNKQMIRIFLLMALAALGFLFTLKGKIKAPVPIVALPTPSIASMSCEKSSELRFQRNMTYVIFTFDDGYKSDYELAFPLFKRLGIRGTSYIIGKYPDTQVKDALSWEQICEMFAQGWDFGSHTYEHSNLVKMSEAEIAKSMEQEDTSFLKHSLPVPVSIAFPFGSYNERVVEAIKPYRVLMRKAYYDDVMKKPDQLNAYELDSVSADFRGEDRLKSREKIVDKAIKENNVLIFRTHCIYRNTVNDMGAWQVQTSFERFKDLVEYVMRQPNVKVVTMSQLYEMMKNGYEQ